MSRAPITAINVNDSSDTHTFTSRAKAAAWFVDVIAKHNETNDTKIPVLKETTLTAKIGALLKESDPDKQVLNGLYRFVQEAKSDTTVKKDGPKEAESKLNKSKTTKSKVETEAKTNETIRETVVKKDMVKTASRIPLTNLVYCYQFNGEKNKFDEVSTIKSSMSLKTEVSNIVKKTSADNVTVKLSSKNSDEVNGELNTVLEFVKNSITISKDKIDSNKLVAKIGPCILSNNLLNAEDLSKFVDA